MRTQARWKLVSTVAGAALGLALAQGASAQTWAEMADAGDLLATAQAVSNANAIDGSLGFANDRDLYAIMLEGGGTFSARVTAAGFDPQLFLFDAAGLGVYANDDAPGTSLSLLPANNMFTPSAAGLYYLAISRFNDDPVNDAGDLIFASLSSQVVGPLISDPIAGWTGSAAAGGAYSIALTGVTLAIPEPQTYALLLAGLALLGFAARRKMGTYPI